MRAERGSISLVVAGTLALGGVLAALSADLSRAATARVRAQTAADAAALAAAQELLVPSSITPWDAAADYANRHGATLTRCRCAAGTQEVLVSIELPVGLPFFGGERSVSAQARAVVEPLEMAGLQPWFALRLRCLFAKVSGLTIVSGFRTREEQAELYEQKPELAAPPGHSMHELGLAADLGFPSDAAGRLAHASAGSCGLTFPVSYEDWHIEPIGAVHA